MGIGSWETGRVEQRQPRPLTIASSPDDILDLLGQLVDKSLVLVEERGGAARYRMLDTIRQYGAEKLRESGDDEPTRRRHRDWFLELVKVSYARHLSAEHATWLDRLSTELDNIRAALAWTQSDERGVEAELRFAADLYWFFYVWGQWSEGRRWLEAALARAGPPSVTRDRALVAAGYAAIFHEEFGRAEALANEALELARDLGDLSGVAMALHCLGLAQREQGCYDQAAARLEESLALRRELGERGNEADTLHSLAVVACELGDYDRARALGEESLALAQELGDSRTIAVALESLGLVARLRGQLERAAELFAESLMRQRRVGDRRRLALLLDQVAILIERRGEHATAARLFGAAEAIWQALDAHLPAARRSDHERAVATARAAVGHAGFESAWAEGRGAPLDESIEHALAVLPGTPADHWREHRGSAKLAASSPLTGREREVAMLLARGLTNRQIAAELVIAERTAGTHVGNILNKLGFTTRAQIAAWAVEQGLLRQMT